MEGHQANGAFVACGPPGFTAVALINLGSQARKMFLVIFNHLFNPEALTPNNVSSALFHSLPLHNLVSPLAGEIWFSSSVMIGILLFGLAIFFFVFGLLPYWFKVHMHLSEILGCQHPLLPHQFIF
jgi:Voltage-dependent anion channel